MKPLQSMIRVTLRVYRKTPLYPGLNRYLMAVLGFVNRLRPRGVFVHDTGSFLMNIDLQQTIDAKIYYSGAWEPSVVETIQKLLPAGGVAVDVGANIGYLTLTMARCVGENGKVIAFEPTDWASQRLNANIQLNGVSQVTTVQMGLVDETGEAEGVEVACGYRLGAKQDSAQQQTIRWSTLDRYLEEQPVPRLDLIKCDTDGWETRVVKGSIETLRRFHPSIVFEFFPAELASKESSARELLGLLQSEGYRFFHAGSLAEIERLDAFVDELNRNEQYANVVAMAQKHGTHGS